MIGPMSEQAFAVGTPSLYYFPTYADAYGDGIRPNYGSEFGYTSEYSPTLFVVGSINPPPYGAGTNGGFTTWRIAPSSAGASPQNRVYSNGDTLLNNNNGWYFLYPSNPCFLEGSTILCQVDGKDTYIPVEQLKAGTLVKTSLDGYKKVEIIGKGTIHNPGTTERIQDRLYKCTPSKYPELKDDLFITGCHSILVDSITDLERENTTKYLGGIYVTDKKYRLMACVDERAEPWVSEGTYNIWHFALESEHEVGNYGVYANGGLLVETCSLRFMKTHSNMTPV
jgi:hypothetical protein